MTSTSGSPPALRAEESLLSKFGRFREIGLLAFILVIMLATYVKNPNFLSGENFDDLLANAAILGILALGMMLVIVIRGIDLSIGATLALSGMIAALTVAAHPDLHPWIAVLLGTAVGLVCGAVEDRPAKYTQW